jgi:sucrose-phosphate synthase
MNNNQLYFALFSIHGLVRGNNIELGQDADTGGQVKYVVELARELGRQEGIARVDLFTRQVFDSKVSSDYAQPQEQLSNQAYIIRLPCGPRRYLKKESLWPYLESFIDHTLQYFRQLRQVPDIIHGHYADAGYVGSVVASLLEVPFIFTGHSLGLVKEARLLEKGLTREQIKERYNIGYRIEAEKRALDAASLVITSTSQEIREQYEPYQNYEPQRMRVIPPGTDLTRFYPIKDYQPNPAIAGKIAPFLREPQKPIILAISRADERKNIPGLIQAYGENRQLQQLANLVIVAGNRDDLNTMERPIRQEFTKIFRTIDRYNLYGKVAYPKHHEADEVPEFYRFVAANQGIFVNPALTEPFGLTLIEAAATGLPIVATHDGGPQDIIKNCQNGLLIDPLDTKVLGEALLAALSDQPRWQTWSANGIAGVNRYYSWSSHAEKYLNQIDTIITDFPSTPFYQKRIQVQPKAGRGRFNLTKMPLAKRVVISDIDETLIGDANALKQFLAHLSKVDRIFTFGIATGRQLNSALEVLEEWDVPIPDVFITAVGTEIYYGDHLSKDAGWEKHINFRWEPERLQYVLSTFTGLTLQAPENQSPFKLSYFIDESIGKQRSLRPKIVKHLRENHLRANVILTYGAFLDLIPTRASKGLAIRYLSYRWGLPLEHFLVAGDSGNDEEMLRGDTLGVVVGNYSSELEKLRGSPRIYFAQGHYAQGILEGITYFNFLNERITPHDEIENH